MDLADKAATELFERWADGSRPRKAVIAQTVQGQLDVAWLDLTRNPERQVSFPNAHQDRMCQTDKATLTNKDQLKSNATDGYQSFGTVFPERSCFDYVRTSRLLNNLGAERIKAVFSTNKGWFIFNAVDGVMTILPCKPSANSRIEIIATQNNGQDIPPVLNQWFANGCSDLD